MMLCHGGNLLLAAILVMICGSLRISALELCKEVGEGTLEVRCWRPRVEKSTFDTTQPQQQLLELAEPSYKGFVNSYSEYKESRLHVWFDVCQGMEPEAYKDENPDHEFEIEWKYGYSGDTFFSLSDKCKFLWKADQEGIYTAKLTLFDSGNAMKSQDVQFKVEDLWVVAMGDDFIAGSGNPDSCFNPVGVGSLSFGRYISEAPCYRSAKSFGYHTYEKIVKKYPEKGIQFTYVACGGATIPEMMAPPGTLRAVAQVPIPLVGPVDSWFAIPTSSPYDAVNNVLDTSQLERVKAIHNGILEDECVDTKACKESPDLVLVTIGSNDVDMRASTAGMATFGALWSFVDSVFIGSQQTRKKRLGDRLEKLNKNFNRAGITPESVFYVGYSNPSRDHDGKHSAGHCAMSNPADPVNLLTTAWMLPRDPLNTLALTEDKKHKEIFSVMKEKSQKFGWHHINLNPVFKRHGWCSKDSYIKRAFDLCVLNPMHYGNVNEKGHNRTAEYIWPSVNTYLNDLGSIE